MALGGVDHGVPPAGAGAEQADLAVEVGLGAHPGDGGGGIGHHLRVRNAAFGAHLGGDVVRMALARALIEIGADRHVAMMREAARRLDVELAPAGEVMDEHDAGEGALTFRPGHVGGDRGSLVAVDGDVLARHASIE